MGGRLRCDAAMVFIRIMSPFVTSWRKQVSYPHAAAFQDPTHVNIITRDTHVYFTRPELEGRMQGFKGDFECIRVVPARGGEFEYQPNSTPGWFEKARSKRRDRRNKNSHLIWEFRAIEGVEA